MVAGCVGRWTRKLEQDLPLSPPERSVREWIVKGVVNGLTRVGTQAIYVRTVWCLLGMDPGMLAGDGCFPGWEACVLMLKRPKDVGRLVRCERYMY
jgi:hypothetical protein